MFYLKKRMIIVQSKGNTALPNSSFVSHSLVLMYICENMSSGKSLENNTIPSTISSGFLLKN